MLQPRTASTYVLAASLFALAGALVFFSVTLKRVADGMPPIIEGIQETQTGLEPIVAEIQGIRELIPGIVDEVDLIRQEIPGILEEVGEIRKQIPPILSEVAEVRNQVPPILEEAKGYRETIPTILNETAELRAQIPQILNQVDAIQQQIPPIVEEVGEVRETIPSILAEIEAVREAVPGYLDQAQEITDGIEKTVQKAGESAVQGVFTGIVKAPVSIVSNLGGNVLNSAQFDDRDRELVIETTEELLNSGEVGEASNWRNSKTGARGKITFMSRDGDCATLRFESFKRLKKIVDREALVCRQENGDWDIIE